MIYQPGDVVVLRLDLDSDKRYTDIEADVPPGYDGGRYLYACGELVRWAGLPVTIDYADYDEDEDMWYYTASETGGYKGMVEDTVWMVGGMFEKVLVHEEPVDICQSDLDEILAL